MKDIVGNKSKEVGRRAVFEGRVYSRWVVFVYVKRFGVKVIGGNVED